MLIRWRCYDYDDSERLAGVLNYHVELVHKTNLARTNVANNQQELLAQGISDVVDCVTV